MTPDQLRSVADELDRIEADVPLGDGSAVFLEDMTEEEFERYEYEQKHGWGSFLKKLGLPVISDNNDENKTNTSESADTETRGEEDAEWLGDDDGSDTDEQATES